MQYMYITHNVKMSTFTTSSNFGDRKRYLLIQKKYTNNSVQYILYSCKYVIFTGNKKNNTKQK